MNDQHRTNDTPRLWGLGAIALVLRWLEELLALVNGPVLMVGAGIALVDLLTDGSVTAAVPLLLIAWALSQALGIDTQLLGCFARAREAVRRRAGWAVVGWLALGALLAYFAWQAGYVFAVQQAEHITEAAALRQLGLPAPVWLGERAALAVGLVALSGWTRYHPPAKHAPSLADERAQLERELTLEPLRQAVRARKAIGGVGLGRQVLAAAFGNANEDSNTLASIPAPSESPLNALHAHSGGSDDPPLPPLPTGPGSPLAAPFASKRGAPDRERADGIHLVDPGTPTATPRHRRTASAQSRVRRVLAAQPTISTRQLAKAAHVSDSTASKHRALWRVEREREPLAR